MKYSVLYECIIDEENFEGGIEVERDSRPTSTDIEIFELARRDSVRFIQAGTAGLVITSITEIS